MITESKEAKITGLSSCEFLDGDEKFFAPAMPGDIFLETIYLNSLLGYDAPELLESKYEANYDHRASDVFSLGVLFFIFIIIKFLGTIAPKKAVDDYKKSIKKSILRRKAILMDKSKI